MYWCEYRLILWCIFNYSKDVRLPLQLQRAMAAEAEASREARAKVGIQNLRGKKSLDKT